MRPPIHVQDEGPFVVPPAFARRAPGLNRCNGLTRSHLIGNDGQPQVGGVEFASVICRFAPASGSLKNQTSYLSLTS